MGQEPEQCQGLLTVIQEQDGRHKGKQSGAGGAAIPYLERLTLSARTHAAPPTLGGVCPAPAVGADKRIKAATTRNSGMGALSVCHTHEGARPSAKQPASGPGDGGGSRSGAS